MIIDNTAHFTNSCSFALIGLTTVHLYIKETCPIDLTPLLLLLMLLLLYLCFCSCLYCYCRCYSSYCSSAVSVRFLNGCTLIVLSGILIIGLSLVLFSIMTVNSSRYGYEWATQEIVENTMMTALSDCREWQKKIAMMSSEMSSEMSCGTR